MSEVIEKSVNIILLKTQEEDLNFIIQAERHPDNSPFVGQWTREKHKNALSDVNMLHLTVKSICETKPVGYIIIAGINNPNQSIELRRIVITDKGRGYGRATLKLVKKMVFEKLKAHRLWLDARKYNTRARALYRSEGFTEEGTLRDCILYNGSFESLVVMSILQDEYFKE